MLNNSYKRFRYRDDDNKTNWDYTHEHSIVYYVTINDLRVLVLDNRFSGNNFSP